MANKSLKDLMANLFFPAILGSMVYTLISNFVLILRQSENKCGFFDLDKLVWVKFLLCISLILFYCIDYLYTVEKKKYVLKIFILDIGVLISISTMYFGVGLDSQGQMGANAVWFIVLPHLLYAGFFTCYDFCLSRDFAGKAKALYLKFAKFQALITVFLLASLVIASHWKDEANFWVGVIMIGVLLRSALFYGRMLKKYREIQELLTKAP